jgi:hypothetical protein
MPHEWTSRITLGTSRRPWHDRSTVVCVTMRRHVGIKLFTKIIWNNLIVSNHNWLISSHEALSCNGLISWFCYKPWFFHNKPWYLLLLEYLPFVFFYQVTCLTPQTKSFKRSTEIWLSKQGCIPPLTPFHNLITLPLAAKMYRFWAEFNSSNALYFIKSICPTLSEKWTKIESKLLMTNPRPIPGS